MDAMRKRRTPSKVITTEELLKKIRKPPAPPARVHAERKKYKRSRVRISEENET